jgi:Do/DeqQ family serine protease
MSVRSSFAAGSIALALSVPWPLDAAAQDRLVPPSPQAARLSYAPIVKKVSPAVVTVSAIKGAEVRSPMLDDPFFKRFARERSERSLGSGVIMDEAGLVVTNNHVVEGFDQVKITLSDRREFEVDIVLKDARTDLAVLRVRNAAEAFPVLGFGNSDELQVGDLVLAVGNPFGVGQTVTHGIVSALARTQVGVTDYQFFIQTDAAINPGNSGGALVDMAGQLIGINTAIFSKSGGSQGVGFAIPANMVRLVVASARGGGTVVKRPWLGAKLQPVTKELAEKLELKRPAGAVLGSIAPGGPAARAGLYSGDVIIAVDDQPVDDPNAFDYRFATKPLGDRTRLVVVRDGKQIRLAVTLETAPEAPRDELTIHARTPFQGLTVVNLSPAVANELGIDTSAEGVTVIKIADGTPAQEIGFHKGDVVISVNNQPMVTTRDLDRIAQSGAKVWRVVIQRGVQQISATFGGG